MPLSQDTFNQAYGAGAWMAPVTGGGAFLKAMQDAEAAKFQREQADLDRAFKQQMLAENTNLRRQQMTEASKQRADAQAQAKRPNETTVRMLSEAQMMPQVLSDIGGLVQSKPNLFGPAAGRVGALNPYNKEAQQANAQLEAAAQMVGKYMEGGVLRAEDVIKYKRMLPQAGDLPDVANAKLENVRALLTKKYNTDLESLKAAKYDVSGFTPLAFQGGGAVDRRELAQQALNDPEATPEEKAAAKRILGMP